MTTQKLTHEMKDFVPAMHCNTPRGENSWNQTTKLSEEAYRRDVIFLFLCLRDCDVTVLLYTVQECLVCTHYRCHFKGAAFENCADCPGWKKGKDFIFSNLARSLYYQRTVHIHRSFFHVLIATRTPTKGYPFNSIQDRTFCRQFKEFSCIERYKKDAKLALCVHYEQVSFDVPYIQIKTGCG